LRQLFLMDHAGLPLTTVLGQLELLGGEVVPVLRKEIAAKPTGSSPARPSTRPAPAACSPRSSTSSMTT
jgi:hypothetical protein